MADTDYTGEIWKDIPGYEGLYQASNMGRLRSLPRRVPCDCHGTPGTRLAPGKVLKLKTNIDGYFVASFSIGGARRDVRVNRMVALAFLGEPPTSEHHAAHNDGDCRNDKADNIRWASSAENGEDRRKHGRSKGQVGELGPGAVLTGSQVRFIRAANAGYGTGAALAQKFGVSNATISDIRNRRSWTHIE